MPSLVDADTAPPDALRLPENAESEKEDVGPKEPTIGEDGVPILKTFSATDNDTRAEALHIIADSVAQQRNTGANALIFHPIVLAVMVGAFAVLIRIYAEPDGSTNWIMVGTTSLGVIMAVLGGIRMMLGPYIFEAERVGTWKWLNAGRSADEEQETGMHALGDSDEILLTKFGDDYIGAIIFRGVQSITSPASPGSKKRTRRAQSPTKHTKLVIRAWSVRQKFRRKEVGSALLEDAIKVGQAKGWIVDGVEFAKDHANSKRVLPAMFNGALDKYDRIANSTLEKKLAELDAGQEKGKKRK